tara:strand:+ start:2334 stop:2516 length:183 start_codon:yes stop_codon:yes gene_type:complete
MPTYNYKCKNEKCNHKFEKFHKMSDPKPPCPECGTEDPERIIVKTTFVLKGSGWFNTGGY